MGDRLNSIRPLYCSSRRIRNVTTDCRLEDLAVCLATISCYAKIKGVLKFMLKLTL